MENEPVWAGLACEGGEDLSWAAGGDCGYRAAGIGLFIYLAVLFVGRRLRSR